MNNIYLVGFMGTGKTSVGKKLAQKKNWRFVDLDELIELKEKMTIVDIFAKKGEPYFRRREKETLKEVSKESNFVVACGGGIVLDEENIKIMQETGTPICLTSSPSVIFERTKGHNLRPLLNTPNPLERIKELLEKRAPFYARIEKKIDTSNLSIDEVVEEILKLIS
jgi:shikimate kinase